MWKTTDRYVQQVGTPGTLGARGAGGQPFPHAQPLTCGSCFQKRLKAAEAESKLKQVYIPN